MILPPGLDAGLVTFEHPLGLTTAALPLASGAAAALMVTQNNNSALVGVMVAAALLPPLAAIGLLVGGGEYARAVRALATVVANVVAITLAAQVGLHLEGYPSARMAGRQPRHVNPLESGNLGWFAWPRGCWAGVLWRCRTMNTTQIAAGFSCQTPIQLI